MLFLKHDDVTFLRRAKKRNEDKLACKLYDILDKNLKPKIQQRVAKVLSIFEERNVGIGNVEDNLQVWRYGIPWDDVTGYNLQEVLKNKGNWTLEDCSDLTRIISKAVTYIGRGHLDANPNFWEKYNKNLLSYREETKGKYDIDKKAFGKLESKRKESDQYGKDRGYAKLVTAASSDPEKFRARGYTPSKKPLLPMHTLVTLHKSKYKEPPQIDNQQNILHERKRIQQELMANGILPSSPGLLRWRLRNMSSVGRIDKVFGLPFGGDISGTTSGSLFTLGKDAPNFSHRENKEYFALMKLLPLATMVKNQHHTVLECALSLTVNNVIDDYCIGFYSTLMPKDAQGTFGVGKEVRDYLQRYENNKAENPLMLTYTRADLLQTGEVKVLRGLKIEPGVERDRFKELASVGHNYDEFIAYGGNNTTTLVCDLVKKYFLGPAVIKLMQKRYDEAVLAGSYEDVVDCAYLLMAMDDRARARRAWNKAIELATADSAPQPGRPDSLRKKFKKTFMILEPKIRDLMVYLPTWV